MQRDFSSKKFKTNQRENLEKLNSRRIPKRFAPWLKKVDNRIMRTLIQTFYFFTIVCKTTVVVMKFIIIAIFFENFYHVENYF